MASQLSAVDLRLRTIKHQDAYFNSKLVFMNLESVLKAEGHRIKSVETRQNGRGTPPALRIWTDFSRELDVDVKAKIRLIDSPSGDFRHKLVFDDLEVILGHYDLRVVKCETRENGQHSPLAVRLTVTY